ncbi:Uncharacterised protein [Bordetella pertussis]|nr:Uncharacterised protein [Bordetella pertussis]
MPIQPFDLTRLCLVRLRPLATAYAVACARHAWAPPHFRIQ